MIHENAVSPISTYVTLDCPSCARIPYARVRSPGKRARPACAPLSA